MEAGGFTTSTTISGGGLEEVLAGGITSGAIVTNGGTLELLGGATAGGTVISSGGTLEIGSGYDLMTYVVSSGVTLDIASGGMTSAVTVDTGGTEYVSSGGSASATTLSGGELEVASSGSIGAGPVTFTSAGGILQLDASQSFHGLISGFGSPAGVTEDIDLRDIKFSKRTKMSFTEASNNLSGTLTITDGTHTATLTLLGQYAAGNFHLASDGHGGTLVTDPPLVGSAANPVLAGSV